MLNNCCSVVLVALLVSVAAGQADLRDDGSPAYDRDEAEAAGDCTGDECDGRRVREAYLDTGAKLTIKRVVRSQYINEGRDYLSLWEDGSFGGFSEILGPLYGTWTDRRGKGRRYVLVLDDGLADRLLASLSAWESQTSATPIILERTTSKPVTATLRSKSEESARLRMTVRVAADDANGRRRTGTLVYRGSE